ncbi:uncharacterized protein [Aristolochia californica]|uniref:uncharacterized protein n=1 Tax=Aristolochia californica TaxID=171875 RepID=UPI0035D5ADF7
MRIRNSSRVDFSLLSPQPLPQGSSFARKLSVEKPEEAKQYRGDAAMRRGGGEDGSQQEGGTGGEVHQQKNQMLTACGFEDRSISDADRTKCSLGTNGRGVSTIIEQALHGEGKEEGLRARERSGSRRRRRETNTKNSGAQISKGDERWMEEETLIPLKKRKASYGWGEEVIMEKETKTKTQLKRKIPRKRIRDEEAKESNEEISSAVKKHRNSNGGALMEGSRCSRINGRGWRCCQQTLVGYSLCEHHLGKGRLRSMSTVRSRAAHLSRPANDSVDHGDAKNGSPNEPQDNQPGLEEKETSKKTTTKRRKLGMVKARSISSLLDQTTYTIPNPSSLPLDRNIPAVAAAAAATAI